MINKTSRMINYIKNKKNNSSNIFWKSLNKSWMFLNKSWVFFRESDFYYYLRNKKLIINELIFNKPNFSKYRNINKHYKISFCITSMNRLCHIKKTLRKNIEDNIKYPEIEFVLLDYSSTDGLEDWVNNNCKKYLDSGLLKFKRIEGEKYFHMAKAKNLSHRYATGDILCSLDADNYTRKDFAYYINWIFNKDINIIAANTKIFDCNGRVIISKKNFEKINGYDEDFYGWGHEDVEIKYRAISIGLKKEVIPLYFCSFIPHRNNSRYINYNLKKDESDKKNKEIIARKHGSFELVSSVSIFDENENTD
jgi:hypothetical protein